MALGAMTHEELEAKRRELVSRYEACSDYSEPLIAISDVCTLLRFSSEDFIHVAEKLVELRERRGQ